MPKDAYHYWYLNADTEIVIDDGVAEMTIVIKQSTNSSYSIKWPKNILWSSATPHQMSIKQNSMDLVKLYKLPESIHFIGQIVAQNCNY